MCQFKFNKSGGHLRKMFDSILLVPFRMNTTRCAKRNNCTEHRFNRAVRENGQAPN